MKYFSEALHGVGLRHILSRVQLHANVGHPEEDRSRTSQTENDIWNSLHSDASCVGFARVRLWRIFYGKVKSNYCTTKRGSYI
jgi:hypothetical protein